jgi:hypothetical protein
VQGRDAAFQNKVHLGVRAKGFGEPQGSDEPAD